MTTSFSHPTSMGVAAGGSGRGRVRAGGFTLFELLIVIGLMAIVAAMAVPRYSNAVGRYRAEAAAKRVAADLTLARAKARAASSAQSVTFNATAGSYVVSSVRNLDLHSGAPYSVNLAGAPYYVTINYADFGGAPQAQFDMYGSPQWGGTVTVRSGDYSKTVQLYKADGSVTVQ